MEVESEDTLRTVFTTTETNAKEYMRLTADQRMIRTCEFCDRQWEIGKEEHMCWRAMLSGIRYHIRQWRKS